MPTNAEILQFFHYTKIMFQFRLTVNIWGRNRPKWRQKDPLLNNCNRDAKVDLQGTSLSYC